MPKKIANDILIRTSYKNNRGGIKKVPIRIPTAPKDKEMRRNRETFKLTPDCSMSK